MPVSECSGYLYSLLTFFEHMVRLMRSNGRTSRIDHVLTEHEIIVTDIPGTGMLRFQTLSNVLRKIRREVRIVISGGGI